MSDFTNTNNFKEQEKVIERNYCDIYTFLDKQLNITYFSASLKNQIKDSNRSELISFSQEINMISKFNHPSILKYIGYIPNFDKKPMIITEYCKNGTLETILTKTPQILSDTQKLIIIYGIANSLFYLHSNEILHFDIQLNNVFLDESFHPKLSNFSSSRFSTNNKDDYIMKTWLKTPRYISPEVWQNQEYTKKSEIYSFSILFYELMTNEIAYSDIYDIYELRDKVIKGIKPSKMNQLDENYQKLIEQCLNVDPTKRPTIEEILKKLKEDRNFITKNVNEEEYKFYVQKIEESTITFDLTKVILYKDFIEKGKKQQTFSEEFNPTFYLNQSIELNHLVNLDDYEKHEKLGQATESESFILIDKKSGIEYVGKTSLNEFSKDDYESIIKLSFDVSKLIKIKHHSFVKYIGYSPIDYDKDYRPVIVTKFMKNYTLERMIQMEIENIAPKSWNITKKAIVVYGMASAMSYLHSHDIIHQTLNTFNILLDQYLIPTITGIGSFINSKISFFEIFNQEQHRFAYFAPEYMVSFKPTKEIDVYSFGIIVYEMFSLKKFLADDFSMNAINSIIEGKRPSVSNSIPPLFRDIIEACWLPNDKNRPTFDMVVKVLKKDIDDLESYGVNRDDFLAYVNYIDNYFYDQQFENFINLKSETFQKVSFQSKKQNELFSFDMETLDLEKYEKLSKIAEGSFGIVYKIMEKESENVYAAKISKAEINTEIKEQMIDITREVTIISKIYHPSIIKFIGYSPINFKHQSRPVIVTELYSGGSLAELIELEKKSRSKIGWNDTKKLINIYGIASSLKYLHMHNIIHRDLRPSNVLLDDCLYPKLADFGLSKELTQKNTVSQIYSGFKGTPAYVAPEIWHNYDYRKAGDVYAFAFTVFEIMTNQDCYPDVNDILIIL